MHFRVFPLKSNVWFRKKKGHELRSTLCEFQNGRKANIVLPCESNELVIVLQFGQTWPEDRAVKPCLIRVNFQICPLKFVGGSTSEIIPNVGSSVL